jgi:hypothetical protein
VAGRADGSREILPDAPPVSAGAPSALGVGIDWERLFRAPAPGQHVAQLYTEPSFLARTAGEYAGEGLRRGEAVLLVVTAVHGAAIGHRLEADGFSLSQLVRLGQLTVLDPALTAAALLVEGRPARARFQAVIGGIAVSAKAAGYRPIRVVTDAADLLYPKHIRTALKLEELWAEFLTAHGATLLCGHAIDNFDPESYRGLLQQVSGAHSHLVPVEDYARLDRAVKMAYAEVFGAGQDASFLRRAFLAHYPRSAAMPDAEAAMLAAREFIPPLSADALLDRARHHFPGWRADRRGLRTAPEGHVRRPSGPRSSLSSSGVRPKRRASSRMARSSRSSASPTASISAGVSVPSSSRRIA